MGADTLFARILSDLVCACPEPSCSSLLNTSARVVPGHCLCQPMDSTAYPRPVQCKEGIGNLWAVSTLDLGTAPTPFGVLFLKPDLYASQQTIMRGT